MTAEKEISIIFNADVLAEHQFGEITFRLFSNGIYYVHVPKFQKIGLSVIYAGIQFLENNGGGKFYNIFHFDSFSDVDPEARAWTSDSDGNNYTICDAIVIGSLSQKIMSDFYLRFNKPAKPTKIFYSLENAVNWIEQQRTN
jgi:hypothetical protein